MTLSNRATDKLGDRIRDADDPSSDDLTMLGEVLAGFNDSLDEVVAGLRSIGLEPTTRLKTSRTLVEKLRRQPHLKLHSIRDLAGARIVRPMTLDEQDELGEQIAGLWPNTQKVDRRADPMHGYRALHLVPRVRGRCVEIQLRTHFQDTWAQMTETLGDLWGREIRYGGEPEDPETIVVPGDDPLTRAQMVDRWKGWAETLWEMAVSENDLARARVGASEEELLAIDETLDHLNSQIRPIREQVKHMKSLIDGLP